MSVSKSLMMLMLVLIMSVSFLFSEVKNQDKPLKGKWDFQPKKVWMMGEAGDDLLARPRGIQVADDGTVYVYDSKNSKFYSFTNDGKFIAAFCKRGEGPGELKRFMSAYVVKNTLIVADMDKLSYFTKTGKFIKSVSNNFMIKQVNHFLNEDECIHFPLLMLPGVGSSGKIYRYNLKTKEEKALAEYQLFKGGKAGGERRMVALVVPPLAPMVSIGYGPDKLYYGVSGSYEIIVADYNGKKLNSFSLDRPKRAVSKEVKTKYFKLLRLPPGAEDMLPTIMKSYPDELTHFCRIDVHNNLIYVYTTNLARSVEKQEIDIFSPEGKYLYKSHLSGGEGNDIFVSPVPLLVIKGDYLYAALVSKDDEAVIAKYKIQLPKL